MYHLPSCLAEIRTVLAATALAMPESGSRHFDMRTFTICCGARKKSARNKVLPSIDWE